MRADQIIDNCYAVSRKMFQDDKWKDHMIELLSTKLREVIFEHERSRQV